MLTPAGGRWNKYFHASSLSITFPLTKSTQSAGGWLAGVNRQLGRESPLAGGPRFAAGNMKGPARQSPQSLCIFP